MRGSMNRRGRGGAPCRPTANHAYLKSNIVKHQTNSARRLQKDLRELKEADVPLVGVSAAPLDNDLFTWHANIRGPEHTVYAGGVFHLQINFQQDYPVSPPSITLFTTVPHSNVFGSTICLDMLQINKEPHEGWVSAYTVESILIQLQAFLFEGQRKLPAGIEGQIAAAEWTSEISAPRPELKKYKDAVDEANQFKCSQCKHKGPIEPYPPFFNDKKEDFEEAFIILRDPKKMLEQEFLCFHSRTRLAEASLGIGVSISRLPRTGEIRSVQPSLDLLCLRAFTKQKVRTDMTKRRFTSWLPLYFGEKNPYEVTTQVFNEDLEKYEKHTVIIDPYARFIKLLKKSLCFLTKGDTRKELSLDMVIEVLPKLIITHLVEMLQENKHISIVSIRRLVNFIRLFRLLAELVPGVDEFVDKQLETFIKNPDLRIKDHFASLGDLLAYSVVSKKFKFADLKESYLEEQLDRQAFWIIKAIPELDHTDPKYKGKELIMEEARNEVCFKTGLVGFQMTMVFFSLCEALENTYNKDFGKLCADLDSNFGCLSDKAESQLQKKFQAIQKVENFNKYYTWLGQQCLDLDALSTRLRKAIDNSKAKKYHGNSDHMNELPTMAEQAKDFILKEPSPFSHFDEKAQKFTKDANDLWWKKASEDKFLKVKNMLLQFSDKNLKPADVAELVDREELVYFEDREFNKLKSLHEESSNTKYILEEIQKYTTSPDYDEKFSWRQLFHKLCLEQMIDHFDLVTDFKVFYQYINALGPEVPVLRIKILDKTKLKSNHYWLMALLGKLPTLQIVKLQKSASMHCGADMYKFLLKGFTYMQQNSRSLRKIEMNGVLANSEDFLYPILKTQPTLTILKFANSGITQAESKAIGKVLADFIDVREVDLTNCKLRLEHAKDIADGIMRAKKLEVFKAGLNPDMQVGANSIIYNLAFSPKIKYIDLTELKGTTQDTAEALMKLLSISGGLETLILRRSSVIPQLTAGFYQALGENKTLSYLNVDVRAIGTNHQLLAQAIAMNAKKGCSLRAVSMKGWLKSSALHTEQFISAHQVSDKDHELLYGDKKTAEEMKQDQLVKHFHCKLDFIDFGHSDWSNVGATFRPKQILQQKEPVWPDLLHFLTHTPLELNLQHTSINKVKTMELISYVLHPQDGSPADPKVKSLNLSKNVKIGKFGVRTFAPALQTNTSLLSLDLSSCKMGVSGAQALFTALAKNQTLKHLNVFRNGLDVDGARSLGEALKTNCSLEFIDVGHNSIRHVGLTAIMNGVKANPKSALKKLSVRANFIKDDSFSLLFDEMVLGAKQQLTHLFIKNNFLTEYHKIALAKKVAEKKVNVYVDEFMTVDNLRKERVDTSIWMAPLPSKQSFMTEDAIRNLLKRSECGLVADIRVRYGKKVNGRTKDNIYAVVEYAHENSVPRSLKLASQKRAFVHGVNCRVFKSGTRTVVVKPQQKRANR